MASVAIKKALPYIAIGGVALFGLGALITSGVIANDNVQKYGKNKPLDQALAIILIILVIFLFVSAIIVCGAFLGSRKPKLPF